MIDNKHDFKSQGGFLIRVGQLIKKERSEIKDTIFECREGINAMSY